ncbi:hypothetical protein PGTUg99_029223 [Puccinia graminis f. sp. tritici]|uniref:Uncharacterized protein n=1 Tax=Puccinia graminis f. sp. tritici TaxID=56615 RepID=A0A5B0RZN3_PUCGR|nr:hypothetical protein PGTUg99_029223 [Puccinia graminis f. sp. tritici]
MKIHRFTLLAIFGWAFLAYPILSAPWPKPSPMFGSGHDLVAGANAAGHGAAGAKGAGGAADTSHVLHDGLETMHDASVATRPTLTRSASAPELTRLRNPEDPHVDAPHVPEAPHDPNAPHPADLPVTPAAGGNKVLDRTKVIAGAAFKFVTSPIRWASKAIQWVKDKYIAWRVARAKTVLFKHGPEHLAYETKIAEAIKAELTHPLRKGLDAIGVDPRFANPDKQNQVALTNVEFQKTRMYAFNQWIKSGGWRKPFGRKVDPEKAGVADASMESVASDGKNAHLAQETAHAEKNAKLAQETADAEKGFTDTADKNLNHGPKPETETRDPSSDTHAIPTTAEHADRGASTSWFGPGSFFQRYLNPKSYSPSRFLRASKAPEAAEDASKTQATHSVHSEGPEPHEVTSTRGPEDKIDSPDHNLEHTEPHPSTTGPEHEVSPTEPVHPVPPESHSSSISPKSGKPFLSNVKSRIGNLFTEKIVLPFRRLLMRFFPYFFKSATRNKGDTKLLMAPGTETEATKAHVAASSEGENSHLNPTTRGSSGADELDEAHKHIPAGSTSSKGENSHLHQNPQEPHEEDVFHDAPLDLPKDTPHPLPEHPTHPSPEHTPNPNPS